MGFYFDCSQLLHRGRLSSRCYRGCGVQFHSLLLGASGMTEEGETGRRGEATALVPALLAEMFPALRDVVRDWVSEVERCMGTPCSEL